MSILSAATRKQFARAWEDIKDPSFAVYAGVVITVLGSAAALALDAAGNKLVYPAGKNQEIASCIQRQFEAVKAEAVTTYATHGAFLPPDRQNYMVGAPQAYAEASLPGLPARVKVAYEDGKFIARIGYENARGEVGLGPSPGRAMSLLQTVLDQANRNCAPPILSGGPA